MSRRASPIPRPVPARTWIYTITLNPALDHYLEVDEFREDDANRVRAEHLYAGGKGIDVSRAIRHQGGESMALGFRC
jgi:1-phosphofructokinase